MKYLKSINESITIGQVDQTISWIKEKVGYSDLVEIFEEIKQNFDDVGDFMWHSKLPNVSIEYSYLAGKRNINTSFNVRVQDTDKKALLDYINKFLERIESVTKISVKVKMSFMRYDDQIPWGTHDKSVQEAFLSGNLRTIESAEGVEIKIYHKFNNYTLGEFEDFLKDPKAPPIDVNYSVEISLIKDLPNNIFSSDDGTDPIERLPQSIIKDFTEFVNKVKLTKADRKELIDIIERGYRKSE